MLHDWTVTAPIKPVCPCSHITRLITSRHASLRLRLGELQHVLLQRDGIGGGLSFAQGLVDA